jgi:hypothetical protein
VDVDNGDVRDDAALSLLYLHGAAELGGLVLLALANDLRVRLEDADVSPPCR